MAILSPLLWLNSTELPLEYYLFEPVQLTLPEPLCNVCTTEPKVKDQFMSFSPSSPVTGGAQTGLTSPTYTLASDTPPDVNAKQWAVSALGGTQSGVSVHSVSSPFTLSMFRPKVFKNLKPVNSQNVLPDVPYNTYKVITRKGVIPLAGQAARTMRVTTIIELPAGSDVADANSVRAALSCHAGALWAQSAGIGDTVVSGVL